MSKKEDQLLSHNYDGIEEYDNNLPLWWRGLFYATMIFSVIYVGYYHFGPGESQEQILSAELAVAREQAAKAPGDVSEMQLAALLQQPEALEKGKGIFMTRCLACHGPQGGGIVGPNLTDDYWIHGGTLVEIRKTVMDGVPEKGMIAWKTMLTESEVQSVVAYIKSLRGTNPAGGKPPEGQLVSE